ncbi:hypothetical protein BCON_0023g00280 [Botryotinia convoluta]|uniref:Uncharacterized protein n=1 Tax=Botryotinia convoluta TaxID=54673 RepID=A0A4Z1IRR4_9HELO|nr:hypothetical protein BCON_0023g00280 [Botryotinia convoluta]
MGNAGSVPADYSDSARGITILFIVLTTIAIISRTLSRTIQKVHYNIDDILINIGYVTNLGQLVTSLLSISHGSCSLPMLEKITDAELLYLTNVQIALGILYSITILAVKVSVLFMYRRIFTMNNKWFRVGWWFNLLFLFPGWTVAAYTLLGIQVSKGSLGDNKLSTIGSPLVGALNSLSDLMVLALPIGMVMQLKLPRQERIAISATSVSMMRAVRFHLEHTHHWNPAYGDYNDMVMTITESSTGLICACLIIVKPLLRKTREIAAYGTSQLSGLLSSSSTGRRSKSSGSQHSVYNEIYSLDSRTRKELNQGINRVDQYEVNSESIELVDRTNILTQPHIRPWEQPAESNIMATPKVILGTSGVGSNWLQEDMGALADALKSLNINEVDTAAIYPITSPGLVEELLGEIKYGKKGFLVDTKIITSMQGGDNTLTAEAIEYSLSKSLKALKVDKLNILYCQGPDKFTPIPQQAAAMDAQYRAGKFQSLGVCNFSVEMLEEWMAVAEQQNFIKPSVFQGQYNVFCRSYESSIFPMLRKYGIKFVGFSPLAGGFLTGKLTLSNGDEDLKGTRFEVKDGNIPGMAYRYWYDKSSMHDGIRKMAVLCEKFGIEVGEAACRWVLFHSMIDGSNGDAVIVGPSDLEQLKLYDEFAHKGRLPKALVEGMNDLWDVVKDDASTIVIYQQNGQSADFPL